MCFGVCPSVTGKRRVTLCGTLARIKIWMLITAQDILAEAFVLRRRCYEVMRLTKLHNHPPRGLFVACGTRCGSAALAAWSSARPVVDLSTASVACPLLGPQQHVYPPLTLVCWELQIQSVSLQSSVHLKRMHCSQPADPQTPCRCPTTLSYARVPVVSCPAFPPACRLHLPRHIHKISAVRAAM